MKKKLTTVTLCVTVFLLILANGFAQSVPQGITYQGLARNSSGSVIVSHAISIKLGIYTPTINGTLEWEETHAGITTNQFGMFYFIIGQGTSTGLGSAATFSAINWGSGNHFLKIAMDENGGATYTDIDTIQFWSVPYAFNAQTSATITAPLRLHQLADVDTIGVVNGYVLKYNGTLWLPAPDNDRDTALFADSANFSFTSNIANVALNTLSTVDTVLFAWNALNADSAVYADTAAYALNSPANANYWNITGNGSTNATTNFIGTTNAMDLVFKTNNTEQMRITSAGRVGIGTSAPTASLHIIGNDGIIAQGAFGSGATPPAGAGTRMVWYPRKSSFRVGTVTGTQWNDVNIGNYSYASGYNTTASGTYSTALGNLSIASGQNSFAACEGSSASGISSVAIGSGSLANGAYGIAIGRFAISSDSSATAIGYHPIASGKYSTALGSTTTASGNYSVAMGYYANTNGKVGSFVFADESSTNTDTYATADNQFMVKASGGAIFYTNSATTLGAVLPANGGGWSSLSDRRKKENFRKEDANTILNKLSAMEITSWNYKTQNTKIRHIGPMAQDFYAAFKFGESDTTITGVDIDGISLIAIQALANKTEVLKKKSEEIEELKATIATLKRNNEALETRITAMEKAINKNLKTFSLAPVKQ